MKCVSVAPGRGQAGLQGFFLRLKRANAHVEAVATDMAGGYIAAVLKYLPKARLVFDDFHVIRLMNEKLTTLRRDMYRELTGNLRREVLKGIRWLLLKNPENLVQSGQLDERKRLDDALEVNRATGHYERGPSSLGTEVLGEATRASRWLYDAWQDDEAARLNRAGHWAITTAAIMAVQTLMDANSKSQDTRLMLAG